MPARITARSLALFTLAAVLALVGCEGENKFFTGESTLGLSGIRTFDASRFEVEDQQGNILDVLDPDNTFVLTLDEGAGTFESEFDYDGILFNRTGVFDIDGDRIAFDDDPFRDDDIVEQSVFAFQDDGDTLTLQDDQAIWDIDGDGLLEVVSLELTLDRR